MELGIGGRMREARERLGLTQQQIADQLHVTDSAYSNWEAENCQVPYEVLCKLAHHRDEQGNFTPGILQVSINYLLDLPESAGAMSARELNLIYNYRRIPESLKPAIDTMVAQAARIPNEEIE